MDGWMIIILANNARTCFKTCVLVKIYYFKTFVLVEIFFVLIHVVELKHVLKHLF